MRITKVKLNNYVCFYNAPEFELGTGINFIVGKNNSGKTALLDALQILNRRSAHRSVQTIPVRDEEPAEVEDIKLEIEFSEGKLTNILRRHGTRFIVGESQLGGLDYISFSEEVLQCLARQTRIRFSMNPYRLNLDGDSRVFNVEPENDTRFVVYNLDIDNLWQATNVGTLDDPSLRNETVWQLLLTNFNHLVYRFEAQRSIEAHSSTRNELTLNSNASNLAQVMDTARRKRSRRYERMVELIKTVFPDVREIEIDKLPRSSPSDSEDEYLEIVVGYVDEGLERYDLRVPLSACGTGLGQVMAMLYVVVVSDDPRIILIDEPQSFLHPEAVRKLLEIFQLPDYRHHQYILTTHSPTALASVQNKRILLLNRGDMKSTITPIDTSKQANLELTLRTVGARLSDVFGMDNIIWVEGETDESCFPMILRANGIPLYGTKILRVAHTGDFTSEDHGAAAVKLYKRLSAGEALLPPALAFVFDADMEDKLQAVRAELGNLVKLLPRQNYECYLIEPSILAEILNRDGVEEKRANTTESVSDWIRKNNGGYEDDDSEWLAAVDGKKFLDKLFCCLGGISYKDHTAAYGEEITKRILADNPNHFQEIVDLITSILERDKQPEST